MSATVPVPQTERSQRPRAAEALAISPYAHRGVTAVRPRIELASSRAAASNPNHHLWKNGRLWWIAFTLIHDGWRQERIRQSLGTDNLREAQRRRDSIFSIFATAPSDGCLDPEPEVVAN